MNHKLIITGALFVFLSVSNLSAALKFEKEFSVGAGFRLDQLNWNIAGNLNGSNPNVVSELTWEDLQIYQVVGKAKFIIGELLYLRGSGDYGWFFKGENRDSDYLGDNRTVEFSRSNSDARGNHVMDISSGLGLQYHNESESFKIAPLGGYAQNQQKLKMTNGVQTVASFLLVQNRIIPITPPLGPFYGLDSSYDAQWKGPWAGVDFSLKAGERLTLSGSFEYHWVRYRAGANWNLRDDFAHPTSFEHEADGTGKAISFGADYLLGKGWNISTLIDFQNWSTEAGIAHFNLADGRRVETRLNKVNWQSLSINLGIGCRF